MNESSARKEIKRLTADLRVLELGVKDKQFKIPPNNPFDMNSQKHKYYLYESGYTNGDEFFVKFC